MFENLRFGGRLALLISAMVVLVIAILGLGLHGMKGINDRLKTVYEDRTVCLVQLSAVERDLMKIRLRITAMSLGDPKIDRAKAIGEIQDFAADMDRQWKNYLSTYIDPEERILVDDIQARFDTYGTVSRRAVDLIQADDIAAAQVVCSGEGTTAFHALEAALVKDIALQERLADDGMPLIDRDLAGKDGGAATVAFLNDFQQIVAGLSVDGFQGEVVQDQQLDAEQRAAEPGVTAIALGQSQISEHFVGALIKNGLLVAARLVSQRASEPGFTNAGRTADDQVVVFINPFADDEGLEQRSIQAARRAVIDVLDGGLMAQAGIAQPADQFLVGAVCGFAIQQQSQPFRRGEVIGLAGRDDFVERLGHAEQAQAVELVEGWMGKHMALLNGSTSRRECWDDGSPRRRWRAWSRFDDPGCCRGWI